MAKIQIDKRQIQIAIISGAIASKKEKLRYEYIELGNDNVLRFLNSDIPRTIPELVSEISLDEFIDFDGLESLVMQEIYENLDNDISQEYLSGPETKDIVNLLNFNTGLDHELTPYNLKYESFIISKPLDLSYLYNGIEIRKLLSKLFGQ